MKLTFLGTAGSTISVDRSYPAYLINDDLLLDCGEGTTQQLLKCGALTNKIKTICITHLHNDHFMGAFSLLWHYWISQRKEDIEIIGPPKLEETFETILNLINTPEVMRSFKIHYHELKDTDQIQEIERDYKIKVIKVNHGIVTYAFRIESENKSVCYSGDTKPSENLITIAKNCDILITESTFPDSLKDFAHQHYHSSTKDAAEMAMKANCKKLALVHIPSAFERQTKKFKKEAEEIFKNEVIIGEDLKVVDI